MDRSRPVADPRRYPAAAKLSRNHPLACSRFQIFLPNIGFLVQLIGQYQQVPVNQSVAVGWNSRHSPQELCLLAKLLNTDHVLNVSSVSARPWMVGSSVEANPHVTF